MMELIDTQRALELREAERGAKLFHTAQEAAIAKEQASRTVAAQVLINSVLPEVLNKLTATVAQSGPRIRNLMDVVEKIGLETSAFITLTQVFNLSGKTVPKVAGAIGTALRRELEVINVQEAAPGLTYVVLQDLKKTNCPRHRANVMGKVRRTAGVPLATESGELTQQAAMSLGLLLISVVLGSCNLWIRREYIENRKTITYLELTAEAREMIRKTNERAGWMQPLRPIMLLKPTRWEQSLDGGYISDRQSYPLLKNTSNEYLEDVVSSGALDPTLAAMNTIQETPYRINKKVLEVVKQAWAEDLGLGEIPTQELKPIPVSPAEIAGIDREEYKKAHPEEWREWRREVAKVWAYNEDISRESKLRKTLATLDRAEGLKSESEFYFPVQLDYRTRMYYVPSHLNPQSDDLAKGLLEFAQGVPMTSKGARRLAIAGATLWDNDGMDKASLTEREEWVYENEDLILRSAQDPLSHLWWSRADGGASAWSFLQFCFEWAAWVAHGEGYESHMIVYSDGKCNGTQHHSALSRSTEEARFVCMVPMERPDDLYSRVLDTVNTRLYADRLDETRSKYAGNTGLTTSELSEMLHGKITRNHVKRGTMTYSYGVTYHGIVAQLKTDFPEFWSAYDKNVANTLTGYLGGLILTGVMGTVSKSTENMEFLQNIARVLGRHNLPLNWITPDGFPVRQSIAKQEEIRIRTTFHGEARVKIDRSEGVRRRVLQKLSDLFAEILSPGLSGELEAYLRETFSTELFRELNSVYLEKAQEDEQDTFKLDVEEALDDILVADHETYKAVISRVIREEFTKMYKVILRNKDSVVSTTKLRDTTEIDRQKQANSIAPNFVHSLDATHLRLTVNESARRGITSFAAVHDSFGVHAEHVEELNQVLREQFVRMYEDFDPLRDILETSKNILPTEYHDELPELPEKGTYDVREILTSEFAFL